MKGQQLTEMLPAEDPLIPAADWIVAGKSIPKVDGREFVTGQHRYPSDQKLPGMLYGKVLRPPAFDANSRPEIDSRRVATALQMVLMVLTGWQTSD